MSASDSALKLHVLVYDGTREICRVSMPIAAADNLAHIFPDEDLAIVRTAGIDLENISRRAAASGYAAQVLVDMEAPKRSYRIWLGREGERVPQA